MVALRVSFHFAELRADYNFVDALNAIAKITANSKFLFRKNRWNSAEIRFSSNDNISIENAQFHKKNMSIKKLPIEKTIQLLKCL